MIVIIISIIPILLINIIVAYVCMFQTHVYNVVIINTMCIIIIEENTMLYLEHYVLDDDRYYCYWHYHMIKISGVIIIIIIIMIMTLSLCTYICICVHVCIGIFTGICLYLGVQVVEVGLED